MNKLISLFLLTSLLLLSACSSVPKIPTLEGAARDQALAYAGPIAENLLAGLNDGDYAVFSRDFDQKMLSAIGPDEFQQLRDKLIPRIGLYQSMEAQQVDDHDTLITVTYKGVFEKAKNIRILLTITKAEPHQIAGLYFQ